MTPRAVRRGRVSAWIAIPAALLALTLLVFSYCRFVSVLYARFSHELAARTGHEAVARAAAEQSRRWGPWRSEAYLAVDAATSALSAEAEENSLQALRWAPSDSYLWYGRARILALNGSFGDSMAAALQALNQLAPNSPHLQMASARMGIRYWVRGNPQVRQQWLSSLRYELSRNGWHFRRGAKKNGRAEQLCWIAAAELKLETWCDAQFPD